MQPYDGSRWYEHGGGLFGRYNTVSDNSDNYISKRIKNVNNHSGKVCADILAEVKFNLGIMNVYTIKNVLGKLAFVK